MKRYKIMVPLILGLFIWQGIADAASISTRVRVLEGKVAKQNKMIKNSLKSLQSRETKIEKNLIKIKELESKVDRVLYKKGKKNRLERADKRYAFP